MFTSWLLALALASAQSAEVPADPPVEAPSETGAPAPQLQLQPAPSASDVVRDSASDYAAYHMTIADLRQAPIGSAEDLDMAMDRLNRFYGEDRLVRAWIAYAAIVAARHPEYIDEVRELADYYGPQAALSGLMHDPAFATSFSSAGDAENSVVDAVQQDNAQITEVSERYRAAAYDLQSERWANRVYGDRGTRLARISTIDPSPIDLPDDIRVSLAEGFASGMPASALFAESTTPPIDDSLSPQLSLTVGAPQTTPDRTRIGRILSIAALQGLGDQTDTDAAIDYLLSDPTVERCLAWVRLDLQQCVAAGHYKYEDSFCIAEHALLDVSRCLATESAGQ
jgi:PHD/YefM family antitoxin component YafN of YafNO toxin-antitoxin module